LERENARLVSELSKT